ncbi:MAG: 50S ribosomal protein L18 [Deltaproteobacteria bacterium CG12_big_fil_rev_8_21_14_0_65_43_10]|nr:MAG: 50S ribosomal protein L18 [Deltaproteobacteria bacterium CG2_30_43_15]PIQ45831.1 MAG: 50S ribosomal protein L18 [Deltaproteobacteria bacterium CG12_big_fil_rev_8_21_14_0_65_43_10]PIU85332.1 MAG: 50S ribosomal protein L18 [Deltaproteobacteria bacterium CG06_land_8_20_14_3_00_44_19]PIX24967.1 MAG: 50S ribosomal protein L18 [Deltaproteobacteria bacterium CG_4_8_14_3_um_filter_43_13]PIZ20578.1 MAG: 50S ribosomal protein L18 [Deltaproteobacteria bacterium CG_4_10_14_0_8_um_filter_43_12]PJB4
MALRKLKELSRLRRKKRIKKKIRGTSEKPRLCVFRSAKHIYAQVIDDTTGKTLASASTLSKEIRDGLKNSGNIEAAKKVGELIAKNSLDRDIKKVVFDRNGYLYHGKVKALAVLAREKGLEF